MKRYHRFSEHLKEKFGEKVYKISIDAGFNCPNRDGTLGTDGCIFCGKFGGTGNKYLGRKSTIENQIQEGIIKIRKKYNAKKYIAYLQPFTNTYAPLETLKEIYDSVLDHKDIIGISIATRPDCIDNPILDLIESYGKHYYAWIELGVQTIHNKTLNKIHRGHGISDIVRAINLIKRKNINLCAHIILGLPGETYKDMIETAKVISYLGIDAVKLHMLHVVKGSTLEKDYRKDNILLMSFEEYVSTVVKFIENLSPNILIQRLVSEADSDILIAPDWLANKFRIIDAIDKEIENQDTLQGKFFNC